MLIFERGEKGRGLSLLPECDVPEVLPDDDHLRQKPLHLPEVSENDICRHYTKLDKKSYGVNDGFYPLGSCTMKYNPKVNEDMAALPGFREIHPLAPLSSIQGCMEILNTAENYLCEITGMDRMTFQPAAGAHGEFTGLLMIKAYHESRGDTERKKIIVPDSAHGTNPASVSMVGYTMVSVKSREDGGVDLDELRKAVGEDTAGLMLTNPNTLGLFDRHILEITQIIHDAGGLTYYDGANLNAIMGMIRPGDMGFDIVHLNLHKTFSTPHGGGGPGSGPVGCRKFMAEFLPVNLVKKEDGNYTFARPEHSIGRVRSFYGNFLVVVRALTYLFTLGREGVPSVAKHAVLNANYMMEQLRDVYDIPYQAPCMHEFVMSLENLKKETKVSATDIAKALLDYGIHPPTMYFPLIVKEALMAEPVETESLATIDEAVQAFRELYEKAHTDPESLHQAPIHTPAGRMDELRAARHLILRYDFDERQKGADDDQKY